MTPERWSEVKAIFQEALAAEPAARDAIVARACGDDAELRAEVAELLSSYDGAGSFMTDTAVSTRPMFCSQCSSYYTLAHVVCPADGEVLVEDPAALVDTTLDELYHVEAIVGRGGFGTVYRARHELLRDRVAVKVLKREYSANPSFVRRFLREGRAARAIQHPNIVAIHDMRTSADGLVYLVLEYVDGRTLREELAARGPLALDEAIELLDEIARALDAAHEAGVVHRDLKPENVMLAEGEDGARIVKVLDLGLAKLREQADSEPMTELTMPGQQMGSPHYMSPEQWGERQSDGARGVDARSDVYALGVIAYEMLAGSRPFTGETVWDVRGAHLDASRPVAPNVPAPVGRAIARAVARDRAERFRSAGAFVAALKVGEPAPRRPLAAALGLVAVVAVALAAVGFWWPRTPAAPTERIEAPAPAKSYAAMSEEERLAFVDDRARQVSRLLAGREYRIPPDARAAIKREVDLYAARVGTHETRMGREDLEYVFARARRAAPEIAPAFEREGVPLVIALYLPMIESEYHTDETSRLGARGMFQILPRTGALYGATPKDLDAVDRSAAIAARHFRTCMDEFASDRMGLALALAAYNMGSRDIRTFLDQVVALDDSEAELRFWSLVSNSGFNGIDNRESPRYITRFFAAAIVGENPAAFGLPGEGLTVGSSR